MPGARKCLYTLLPGFCSKPISTRISAFQSDPVCEPWLSSWAEAAPLVRSACREHERIKAACSGEDLESAWCSWTVGGAKGAQGQLIGWTSPEAEGLGGSLQRSSPGYPGSIHQKPHQRSRKWWPEKPATVIVCGVGCWKDVLRTQMEQRGWQVPGRETEGSWLFSEHNHSNQWVTVSLVQLFAIALARGL